MDDSRLMVSTTGPQTWKVAVRGKQRVEQVRRLLERMGATCSPAKQESLRLDPPLFAFSATADSSAKFADLG